MTAPLMASRPVLDREAVSLLVTQAINQALDKRFLGGSLSPMAACTVIVDGVMALAVPAPTAEQVAMKLSLVRFSDEESDRMVELTMREAWPLADAVVELINGSEK
jgi:hypothetical protein